MECVFCKIVNKELPANILYEDDNLVAFKDIKPSAPIHYLIVSKEHIESIAHLEKEHRVVVGELVYAAKNLGERAGLKGYKLVFNVGRDGGQIIDHLHLHLLGGWNNKEDGARMPHPSLDA